MEEQMQLLRHKGVSRATLTVESTAEIGALVGSGTQIDASDKSVEDIPLRTGNPPAYARGIYPLRWDQDYTNLVTVTNTASSVRKVRGYITAGSMTYVFAPVQLEAGTTAVFDVDQWRRDSVPDVNGHTLPKDVAYGKFFWFDGSQGKLLGLMGRNSVASVSNHRRSSFSCGALCSGGSEWAPVLQDFGVGGGGLFGDLPFGSIELFRFTTSSRITMATGSTTR